MRFFHDNHIDRDGVALTPSSEISTLPATNVIDEFRTRVWRTGSSAGTETLVIDFGAGGADSPDTLILLDHTLLEDDTNLLIQANSTNAWGAPAFSAAYTWSEGPILKELNPVTVYRYWRLRFDKVDATPREIGRIFLGQMTELAAGEEPDYDGFDEELIDLVRKQKTLGGQTYAELIDQYRMLRLNFGRLSQNTIETLMAYANVVGQGISHFIQVSTSEFFDQIYYVKLARSFKRKVEAMADEPVWNITMEFEEQL